MILQKPRRELVLVGGGHAHVQVLQRFAMQPQPEVRITLVVDQPVAVYSGMVPGWVAGEYRASQLEIDTWPLARRAGARVMVARATGINPERGCVELEGRPPVFYDVASLDIGSTVAGLDLPGVREHALASRPISRLIERLEAALQTLSGPRIRVVGAGAAGVEMAFCVQQRLRNQGKQPEVMLLDHHDVLLPTAAPALRRRVEAAAARRGIALRMGRRAMHVEPGRIFFEGGSSEDYDLLLWVTGAAAHPLSGDLPRDPRGFIKVQCDLSVPGCPGLFAAGDCAAFDPPLPKAGVYAVRQGPVLYENLRSTLNGGRTRNYVPQMDFLALLNLGDKTALGAKWGTAVEGSWVWALKDRIDRRFMEMFQVLDEEDRPRKPMSMEEMPCGGCAAKVAQDELATALSALSPPLFDPSVRMGVLDADDVAIIAPGGPELAWNLDAFMALTDDPWWMGRLGAANALSDLSAKGVDPRWAMALVGLPEQERADTLTQVMAGAREVLDARRVSLVGGHTLRMAGLQVGFTVLGPVTKPPLHQGNLQPGDRLLLTRPLGTGALFRADMFGEARGIWILQALAGMMENAEALVELARRHGVRAATDVTGFGLAGHLASMLRASRLSARLDLAKLPVLAGVEAILRRGIRSTFHAQNQRICGKFDLEGTLDEARLALLFDPQTCGGLLLGVPPNQAEALEAAFHAEGASHATLIGEVLPGRSDGKLGSIFSSR